MLFDTAARTGHHGRRWAFPALLGVSLFSGWLLCRGAAADLPNTIARVKPSVVAVGTVEPTRAPQASYMGTGFAVGDGSLVVTNAHVVPPILDSEHREFLAVFSGTGKAARMHPATPVATDLEHDLTLLRIGGKPLPPLTLGDSGSVREGDSAAFTGFPIGMVLGLYPVTQHAIVSSITPIAIPVHSTQELNSNMVRRLQTPFSVFQLDAIAYPGNSGSPLFDPESGKVIGVINAVFVKGTKENALSQPTGISYAIPGNYVRALLRRAGQTR